MKRFISILLTTALLVSSLGQTSIAAAPTGTAIDAPYGATGGSYTVEYLTSSGWSTLLAATAADIKNDSNGSFNLEWDRPSNWTTGTVDIDYDESGAASTSDSLYFARLRVTSDYSDFTDFNQIGLIDYNFALNLTDELGNTLTGTLVYSIENSSGVATTSYSEKTDGTGTYYFALAAGDAAYYTYDAGIAGYVTALDQPINLTKNQTNEALSLNFAQKIGAVDANGTNVNILEAYAGTGTTECTINSGDAYCPVPYNEDDSYIGMTAEKYAVTSAALANRDSATEAQAAYDITLAYAYAITVENADDELITGADVQIDNNTCDNLGSGKYGCAVKINTDGDVEITADGYEDFNGTLNSVRNSNSDLQISETFTLTEEIIRSDAALETDLVIDDIYLNSDDEIVVRVQNEGDIDVDEDTRVYIYMYVNGSLKWTKSSKNTSSSSYLSAGSDQSFDTAYPLYKEGTYKVEVYVDYTDSVDEADEGNNYRSENFDVEDNRPNRGDDDDDSDLPGLPDLVLADLEQDGDDITFTVQNEGDANLDSDEKVYTTLYIDGDKEKTWTSERTGFFKANGGSEDFTAKNILEDLDRGVYEVKVCVDAGRNVKEDSETNNCGAEDVYVSGPLADDNDKNAKCKSPFVDTRNHFSEKAVCMLYRMGVVEGRDRTHFEPNDEITRAEFLKMMLEIGNYRVREVDSADKYSDVSESDWYYEYVTYATDRGFVNGYDNGTFRPNESINRAEALVLIMRLSHEELWNFSQRDIPFYDVDRDDWYAYATVIAFREGILEGYKNSDNVRYTNKRSFNAENELTRGEAAVMLRRAWYAFYK